MVGIADGSNYLLAEVIRRPRPADYGVQVLNHIAHYYSFPFGHVVHAVAYVGFLLFLTLWTEPHDTILLVNPFAKPILTLVFANSMAARERLW